jgi:hypothetical protein
MADEDQEQPNTSELEDSNGDGQAARVRSTIAFPYSPLSDAEQVAQGVHQRGGSASMDELAAELNQVITSGAFRTKVASARTFGVVSVRRGIATLTALGKRLVDPTQVDQARADAFLTVPLYRQVFDEYKGHTLPKADGLENTMARLGVSPKQTERARQAFQRSAEQAGYFRNGTDRLVPPVLSGASGTGNETPKRDHEGRLSAAVEALVLQLLDEGDGWMPEDTHEYVRAIRTVYNLSG